MSKVLVIDNYDSFTYNLVHLLEGVNADVTVVRNDELSTINFDEYYNILISPGPGVPSDIPQVKEVVMAYYQSKNILGVCLGHQLISECLGSEVELSEKVFHGVATPITIIEEGILFKGLPNKIKVGRYHSWVVKSIPGDVLSTTAISEEQYVMAFQHKEFPVYGIQFHPESILSEFGKEIITNWLI